MGSVNFLTITDQVAAHLRAEIQRGRWSGSLPGKHQLAAELGINNKTVEAALRQLEKAGILISRGVGQTRLIHESARDAGSALRIGFLTNEGRQDMGSPFLIELHHALIAAGHSILYSPKSLTELNFDVRRVAGMVRQMPVDAWIVVAGSRNVLEWFASQPVPAFAFAGHRLGVRIASVGPDKTTAMAEATRRLITLGHSRIILLCRSLRRVPEPGASETAFLNTLRAHGIAASDYHLPDWEETSIGFQKLLDALFKVTPPTALIVDEAAWFIAVLQFLARRGIRVPADVSLICTDDDNAFMHCDPPVACIAWDSRPVLRRVVNWAENVSRGKTDFRLTKTPAMFVSGGTIAGVGKMP